MFVTNEKQSNINAFKASRALRPRDLFKKVGESTPPSDSFTSTPHESSVPQRPFVSMEEYASWVQSEAKRLRESEASQSRNAGDTSKSIDKPPHVSL